MKFSDFMRFLHLLKPLQRINLELDTSNAPKIFVMHIVSAAALLFLSLLNALHTTAAITFPYRQITNVSASQLLNVLSPPATPSLTYRIIDLSFTQRGRPIPPSEVEDTCYSAVKSIEDIAEDHPDERIFNDRFEYRREGGDMLIVVAADRQQSLTWRELGRILTALMRYMTGGVGTSQPHCQALEFEIIVPRQGRIGVGLVWYLPPESHETERKNRLA